MPIDHLYVVARSRYGRPMTQLPPHHHLVRWLNGRPGSLIGSIALTLVLVTPAIPAAAAPVRQPATDFEVVRSPQLPAGATLAAMASDHDGRAWAVGNVPQTGGTEADPYHSPIIEQWDGHRWRLDNLPALAPIGENPVVDAALTAVSVSERGQVLAVGWQRSAKSRYSQLTLQLTPTGWSALPVPDQSRLENYRPESIAVLDARHVWVAGVRTYHHQNMLLRFWDGTAWTSPELPDISGRNQVLSSVVASDDHDVWAVGTAYRSTGIRQEALALHWDGVSWTQATLPPVENLTFGVLSHADGVAVEGRNNLWLWGNENGAATIERFNGTTWSVGPALPATPAPLAINSVLPTGHQSAWVAGTWPAADGRTTATILAWQHNTWRRASLPPEIAGAHTTSLGTADTRDRRTWVFVNTAPSSTNSAHGTVTILRSRPSVEHRN